MTKKIKLVENKEQKQGNFFDKQNRARYLNARIHPVLSFLDKHKIPINEVNSFADIVEHFKKDFPFPNAPIDRNFELMGIDVSGVEEASKLLKEFKKDFHLVNEKVEINPEWIKANEEASWYYTRTEAEIKACQYANELMKLIQSGYKQGFLREQDYRELSLHNGLVYFFNRYEPEYSLGGIREAGANHEKYLSKK